MEKTIIVETFKQTWFYKLIKTSEAVFVGGGIILGVILGWFDVIPALVIVGGYIALNALGLSNSEPYVVRDLLKEEFEESGVEPRWDNPDSKRAKEFTKEKTDIK